MKLIKYILIAVTLSLFANESKAQCSATFTHSTSGSTTSFTATGTASPSTAYFWRFGDGNTSTLQNPTHTYAVSGTYYAGVEVSDTAGGYCFDSVYQVITVSGSGCPITASFNDSTAGLTSYFYSNVTGATGPVSYLWYFGDGNTSSLVNPIHSYTSAGPYNVVLITTDSAGCSDTILTIIRCNLTANYTHSSIGLTTTFTNTSTGSSSGAYYLWRFGDGNTSTLQNPIHTYASTGTYYPVFIVYDSLCSDSSYFNSVTVTSAGCALTASFTQSSTGLTASFVNTTTGATSTPFYMWHFGDGSPTVITTNPTHTYSTPGTYNVDLIAYDSAGCSDTAYSSIIIVGASTSCPISASFVETISGLTVVYNASSTGLAGLATHTWNFGDGTYASGSTVTHTYSSQGAYSVTITTSDSLCSDSNTRLIAVTSNVFTPNGDGIDDVFPLPCSGSAATIYNTSGTLLKTIAPGITSWDGTNNLGGNEPTGLYFIICTGSSTPIPVTLIR